MLPTASLAQPAIWALLAALAAALGPLVTTPRLRGHAMLGWSSAAAAGAMLGVAYLLMTVGLDRMPLAATVGAAFGVLLTYGAHRLFGLGLGQQRHEAPDHEAPGEGTAPPDDHHDPSPRLATIAGAVHAAPEGVAIGAAFAVNARFGIALALTLALHNVWESAVLAEHLRASRVGRGAAMLLAVLTNLPQVLFAALTIAAVSAAPARLPALLGVAFGALVYLCLAELLPESYGAAGRTGIAIGATTIAAVVAFIGSWAR